MMPSTRKKTLKMSTMTIRTRVRGRIRRTNPERTPTRCDVSTAAPISTAPDMAAGPSLRSVPTGSGSVTPVSPQVKMHIVEPKSFGEAQTIADKFKQGIPVILNLTMTKPELSKRLLDFAAGLTYGLDGGLQRVSDKVFMLTPHNVEVSDADRRRLQSTGVFPGE